MARFLRIWEKKRGGRQTGSKLMGRLGEAIFYALMFLLGIVLMTVLIATRVTESEPEVFGGFWVRVMVLASFILIGGGGLIYTALDVGISAERRSALRKRATDIDLIADARPLSRKFPNVPPDANLTNSPGTKLAYRLPSSQSPAWQLMAATLFFVVWTGITGILTYIALQRFGNDGLEPPAVDKKVTAVDDQADWLLNLSLIPFFAVAIWATRYLWRQIRLQMGIGPTNVEVSDHPLQPGSTYHVALSQAGRLRIVSLEVLLMCEEQATFRQGTDIRTETHPVYRQQLLRKERFMIDRSMAFEQEFELPIPAQAMHSFQGSHNAVHWKLVVRGVVRHWPPFERNFPLVVLPSVPQREDEHGPAD